MLNNVLVSNLNPKHYSELNVDIFLNTKDLYTTALSISDNYHINLYDVYSSLRYLVSQLYATTDVIQVCILRCNTRFSAIIGYTDYNNFDWDLQLKETPSGYLKNSGNPIKKINTGLLYLDLGFSYTGALGYFTINHYSDCIDKIDSEFVCEVCRNIFDYEYVEKFEGFVNLVSKLVSLKECLIIENKE